MAALGSEKTSHQDSFKPCQASTREVLIDIESIRFGRFLGKGSFGEVYCATWQGAEVAVKQVQDRKLSSEVSQELWHEFNLVFNLRSPRIIQVMGFCTSKSGALSLVIEYAPGGALRDRLDKYSSEDRIPEADQACTWAVDIAHGMDYLHSRGVMHCDLKSPNVLLDALVRCKVADFGLAKSRAVGAETEASRSLGTTTVKGSPPWMSPEAINGERTLSSDVYSYGVILWELSTAGFPWKNVPFVTILYKVVMEDTRPPVSDPDHLLHDLMQKCWHVDPTNRPSFTEAVDEADELFGKVAGSRCITSSGRVRTF